MDAHGSQPSPPTRTHGSDQRPPRDLNVAFRDFDIGDLAARLTAEPAFRTDGRNSETVHDDGHVRVLVSVVAAGRDIGADRNDGYVTLSMVQGAGALVRGTGDAAWLRSGATAILAPGAPWSLRAEDTSVLMAYFWAPGGPGASARERAEPDTTADPSRSHAPGAAADWAPGRPEMDLPREEGLAPAMEVPGTEVPGPEDEPRRPEVDVPGTEVPRPPDEPADPPLETPGRDDRPPIVTAASLEAGVVRPAWQTP